MVDPILNNNNKNNIDSDPTQHKHDSGLLPKIWGPCMWDSLHSITFYYPLEPTEQDKEDYKIFFQLLGRLLPCDACKHSYKKIIEEGITKLNDDVLKNRESLTKWLYDVHETVNRKLGVDYGISYEEVVKKFESFRASCSHRENYNELTKGCEALIKSKSYKIANIKICPIIPRTLAQEFIEYAKMRGLNDSELYVINEPLFKKKEDIWEKRNLECNNLIKKIRQNGLHPIEKEGEWIGLPTIDELKLLMRLSSTLSKNKLIELINNLPNNKNNNKKIYKLKK